MDDPINMRYLGGEYLDHNPAWDMADSPWKAAKIIALLQKNSIAPESFCEVGCGAGEVLGSLKKTFPNARFTGYDIAPDAEKFWTDLRRSGIGLHIGDFFLQNDQNYDLILLIDVLEHIADPHQFLIGVKPFANQIVLHFPLDLSVLSILREKPLLHVRRKVGHIHYFTKGLAFELLEECGLEVIDWQYTEAAFNTPKSGWKTRIARLPRRIAYTLNKDAGVRLLGGETLMVLVRSK